MLSGVLGSPVVTVNTFLNNGTGGFFPLPTSTFTADSSIPTAISIAAADFNGDGKTDIAVSDKLQVSIFLSNGDGTFTPSAQTTGATTNPNANYLNVGDFNNDGIPDLAIGDSDLTTMRILPVLSTETATAALSNVSIPGTGIRNVVANYAGNTVFGASGSSSIPVNGSPIGTALSLKLEREYLDLRPAVDALGHAQSILRSKSHHQWRDRDLRRTRVPRSAQERWSRESRPSISPPCPREPTV